MPGDVRVFHVIRAPLYPTFWGFRQAPVIQLRELDASSGRRAYGCERISVYSTLFHAPGRSAFRARSLRWA